MYRLSGFFAVRRANRINQIDDARRKTKIAEDTLDAQEGRNFMMPGQVKIRSRGIGKVSYTGERDKSGQR